MPEDLEDIKKQVSITKGWWRGHFMARQGDGSCGFLLTSPKRTTAMPWTGII